MVEYVIKDKKHKVVIRCEELANARSESELLTNLAKQIGYIPLFQFMNTINNMVDVAITATTGQKAGEFDFVIFHFMLDRDPVAWTLIETNFCLTMVNVS